jgi:hypothetical protein
LTEPDVVKGSLDALHDDIEESRQRVDAILVGLARSRFHAALPPP